MKKNNTQTPHLTEKRDFSDTLAEHPVVEWLSNNGQTLLWVAATVILLLILANRWMGATSQSGELDYFNAENDFSQFQKGDQPEAFNRLNRILSRKPELQAKYDGKIAQILLDRSQFDQAKPFAERNLARLKKDNIPLYIDYASTTLTMAKQDYQTALKEAMLLKEKMIQSAKDTELPAFGDALYAFNLLRIAMIQQQLNARDGELEAWSQFRQALAPGKENVYAVSSDTYHELLNTFVDGNVTLAKYIEYRIGELKN